MQYIFSDIFYFFIHTKYIKIQRKCKRININIIVHGFEFMCNNFWLTNIDVCFKFLPKQKSWEQTKQMRNKWTLKVLIMTCHINTNANMLTNNNSYYQWFLSFIFVCVCVCAILPNSLIFANKITERKLKNRIYGKDTQALFGLIL